MSVTNKTGTHQVPPPSTGPGGISAPSITPAKRALDILGALTLGLLLAPVIAVVATVILLRDGRPVFHVAERMKSPQQGFGLWKFRSMTVDDRDAGVSGADKTHRVTTTGRWMRRRRIDELPQLWNILRGDMSFVGPRPPLRRYVEMFPEVYTEVLQSRPGVTGLATLVFHRREEQLLSRCHTAAETEATYIRRCIPRKAQLDRIYAQRRNLCWDMLLMWQTVFGRRPATKSLPRKRPGRGQDA